jgi:hypothetical protein
MNLRDVKLNGRFRVGAKTYVLLRRTECSSTVREAGETTKTFTARRGFDSEKTVTFKGLGKVLTLATNAEVDEILPEAEVTS